MTCTVYDTCWVANIVKPINGIPQYLFPQSFLAVLQAQLPDGSWRAQLRLPNAIQFKSEALAYFNRSDAILSSLAGLYTLGIHAEHPHQIATAQLPGRPLRDRIMQAIAILKEMLQSLSVDSFNAVGFEVLALSLLNALAAQGHNFDFPARTALLELRAAKLARIRPSMLYDKAPVALLHSLEAFHDWTPAEFDARKVKHHLVQGSVMASPAATASYLMKLPRWDDEAQAYLQRVIDRGEGHGHGGVPSVWPSTNFELLWVVSTLMELKVWPSHRRLDNMNDIVEAIQQARSLAKGLVGFAPGIEPDLDDSAKASIVLSLSSGQGFSQDIVRHFDGSRCLKTYRMEHNPSVSANCNALLAILCDDKGYPFKVNTIIRIVEFLHESWESTKESITDKWNLSPHYCIMLMARTLVELLARSSHSTLEGLSRTWLSDKVVPILYGCLTETLRRQHVDGSWGVVGAHEETAYAVLTLVSLLVLPLNQQLRRQATHALQRGRASHQRGGPPAYPEPLWIEKVSYGSRYLSDAYRLAATMADIDTLHEAERKHLSWTRDLFQRLPGDTLGMKSVAHKSQLDKRRDPRDVPVEASN